MNKLTKLLIATMAISSTSAMAFDGDVMAGQIANQAGGTTDAMVSTSEATPQMVHGNRDNQLPEDLTVDADGTLFVNGAPIVGAIVDSDGTVRDNRSGNILAHVAAISNAPGTLQNLHTYQPVRTIHANELVRTANKANTLRAAGYHPAGIHLMSDGTLMNGHTIIGHTVASNNQPAAVIRHAQPVRSHHLARSHHARNSQ